MNSLTHSLTLFCPQLAIKMDALEQYLKIEKLDPAEVSDAAISHKEEKYGSMNQIFSEVEGQGKAFIKEAQKVSPHLLAFALSNIIAEMPLFLL